MSGVPSWGPSIQRSFYSLFLKNKPLARVEEGKLPNYLGQGEKFLKFHCIFNRFSTSVCVLLSRPHVQRRLVPPVPGLWVFPQLRWSCLSAFLTSLLGLSFLPSANFVIIFPFAFQFKQLCGLLSLFQFSLVFKSFFFFWDRVFLCHPGRNAVAWSWLTAASTSPDSGDLPTCNTTPNSFFVFFVFFVFVFLVEVVFRHIA